MNTDKNVNITIFFSGLCEHGGLCVAVNHYKQQCPKVYYGDPGAQIGVPVTRFPRLFVRSRRPVSPTCTLGTMQGNLRCKFAAHGTEPKELRGGQMGSEKHTKLKKAFYINLKTILVCFSSSNHSCFSHSL